LIRGDEASDDRAYMVMVTNERSDRHLFATDDLDRAAAALQRFDIEYRDARAELKK
jgi:hypothetical protein